MKRTYREGTWFAIPLRKGGFGVGVVARATTKGKVILCYFFGPRRTCIPGLSEVERLRPQNAIRTLRVGDLSLMRGTWPIIGQSESWKRSDWPMPVFIRRDQVLQKAWRVYYADTDPSSVIREEPEPCEANSLPRASLFGAGAAEIELTELLT
jgi:hypothetical protein